MKLSFNLPKSSTLLNAMTTIKSDLYDSLKELIDSNDSFKTPVKIDIEVIEKSDKFRLQIKEPIWKDKSIGISSKYFFKNDDEIEVEIIYRDKQGKQWDKNIYLISYCQLKTYDSMLIKGLNVYLVPIKDLRIKEDK